jgi:hypothetical protein
MLSINFTYIQLKHAFFKIITGKKYGEQSIYNDAMH